VLVEQAGRSPNVPEVAERSGHGPGVCLYGAAKESGLPLPIELERRGPFIPSRKKETCRTQEAPWRWRNFQRTDGEKCTADKKNCREIR